MPRQRRNEGRTDRPSADPQAAEGLTRSGVNRRKFLGQMGIVGVGAMGASGVLAACGGKDASVDDQIGAGTAGAAGTTTTGTPAINDKFKNKTIGFAALTLADANVKLIEDTFKEASDRAGLNWTFDVADGQGATDKAQQGLQSFVSKKVDLIYLEGIPPRLVPTELERAKAAGIPVVGGFTAAPLDPLIMFDYAGVLEGDAIWLANYMITEQLELAAKRKKKRIQIALVDSDLDVILARRKVLEGLLSLQSNAAIEIVASQNIDLADGAGSSSKITASFLTKYPDLDAIWTNYPTSCVAAAETITQKGKADQVKVYGHIANAAAIEALRKPGSPVSATSWVDLVYSTYGTVGYMLDVFAGKPVERTVSYTNPVPATCLARPTIADQIPGDGTTWVFQNASYRDGFIQQWGQEFAA